MPSSFILSLILLLALIQPAVNADITVKSNKSLPSSVDEEQPTTFQNDEKREDFEKIKTEYRSKIKALKPQIKAKSQEIKKGLAKDNLNYEELKKINDELFDLKRQEQLNKIEYQVALSKIYTAEERKSLMGNNSRNSANKPKKAKNRSSKNKE
jgi:hypothetical protein